MLRIVRRAPWIAVGAAAAYFFDDVCGGARRHRLVARADRWARSLSEWAFGVEDSDAPPPAKDGRRAGSAADPPVPIEAVGSEQVQARAAEPLAEETAAGVPSPAPAAMARQILEESEERIARRTP